MEDRYSNNEVLSIDKIITDGEIIKISNVNFENLIFIADSCKNDLLDIKDIKKLIFIDCVFSEKLKFYQDQQTTLIFKNCKFNIVEFHNRKSSNANSDKHSVYFSISKNIEYENYFIEKLGIHQCDFKKKFYINNQKISSSSVKIKKLLLKDTIFEENFKIHNCKIDEVSISNVDFEKNADFYKTHFIQNDKEEVKFSGINFSGLTIFEEVHFYKKFLMEYVTFSGLVQFRNAHFDKGLNLDKTNIEKEINFYGVQGLKSKTNDNQTSQETFRILKYHTEKVGNIVDANIYHSLELEEIKKTINKTQNKKRDNLIFFINSVSSEFGTNYIRPICGMLLTAFITMLLLHFEQVINLSNWYHPIDMLNWRSLFSGIDKVFEYMYILNKEESFQKNGFVFLLNKVMLGYFYYQFIISVRKDTRK